uniref:threonine ammonia-lyase n=1 Tax=Haloprofundus sp. MHR1 TaxID=2572921 RepID=UPI001F1B150D|nr:threonine ammonia-lyase [Haloprofundus sp. MHR1]
MSSPSGDSGGSGDPEGSGESDDSGSSGDVPSADEVVTAADVEAARERLEEVVHRTPLDGSTTFAERSGADAVELKLENVQRTGSFKIRGAYNAMAQLSEAETETGVIAASAGNHAQGVALAGRLLDIDTTIVVPEVTPAAKIDATRGYGAEVVVEGGDYERSYEHALELAEAENLTFVHPFDDERVIAGQGTVGLELVEQMPDADTVLVSIGGGGLISGIATAVKADNPNVRVVGVQPEGAAHAKPSLERDEIHTLSEVDTVAEGIADARLLEKTFAVVRERVDDVVSVTDGDIAVATALLAERAKTVAEAAGAAPVAALLSGAVDVEGERVVAVVSGGNANLSDHAELCRIGLERLGHSAELRLELAEWPTALGDVTDVVEREGAELDALERTRRTAADDLNRTPVRLNVAGSGPDHLRDVVAELEALDGVSVARHSLDRDV